MFCALNNMFKIVLDVNRITTTLITDKKQYVFYQNGIWMLVLKQGFSWNYQLLPVDPPDCVVTPRVPRIYRNCSPGDTLFHRQLLSCTWSRTFCTLP